MHPLPRKEVGSAEAGIYYCEGGIYSHTHFYQTMPRKHLRKVVG